MRWCRLFHRPRQWTLVEWVWSEEAMATVQQEVHVLYCRRCVRIIDMEGAG